MKKALVCVLALAAISSTAMAGSLVAITPYGAGATTDARAITPDGKYVVGIGTGNPTGQNGWIWDAQNGTRGPMLAGSYMESATGVAYRYNPTTGAQELLVGGKMSSGQIGMFLSTNGGTSWTRPYSSSGSAPAVAASNAIGGGAAATPGNAYIGWVDGLTNNIGAVSGDPTSAATSTKNNSTSQTPYVNGMSSNGIMVGARKGADGIRQNTYQIGGAQTIFKGMDGTTHGIASAISGDGTIVFGQSYIVGDTTNNRPYMYNIATTMYNIATTTITPLPLLPGTTGSTNLGYIYGASPDGRYAVGMDYVGMERAALWDTQTGTVIDLTTWAQQQGILGNFTGNLRRAYSVGVTADGRPVIAGMGVYYDPAAPTVALTRGFVMTIPEPATLSFLALGGLALLRRRR